MQTGLLLFEKIRSKGNNFASWFIFKITLSNIIKAKELDKRMGFLHPGAI